MRLACWIDKVTDTHSEYVWSSTATVVNANVPLCYVYAHIACRFGLNVIVIWKKKSIEVLFHWVTSGLDVSLKFVVKIIYFPDMVHAQGQALGLTGVLYDCFVVKRL